MTGLIDTQLFNQIYSFPASHRPYMPNLLLKQLLLGTFERAWEENQPCNQNLNYVAATAAT